MKELLEQAVNTKKREIARAQQHIKTLRDQLKPMRRELYRLKQTERRHQIPASCPIQLPLPEGYYVYTYMDPRDSSIFYVGQGSYNRCVKHITQFHLLKQKTPFYNYLKKLLASDLLPEVLIVKDGLTKEQAYQSEQDLIFLVGTRREGTGTLCNVAYTHVPRPKMTIAQGEAQGTTVECWGETFACLAHVVADPRCLCSARQTLKDRLARGLSLEEAAETQPNSCAQAISLTCWGETFESIGQLSRDSRCQPSLSVLYKRLAEGVPPEKAAS